MKVEGRKEGRTPSERERERERAARLKSGLVLWTDGRSLGVLCLRSAGERRGGAKFSEAVRQCAAWRVEANSSQIAPKTNCGIYLFRPSLDLDKFQFGYPDMKKQHL